MMKAITDLQYESAHVNFITSTGVGLGSLGAKLKTLLELLIGAFEMQITSLKFCLKASSSNCVETSKNKARAIFFNLF